MTAGAPKVAVAVAEPPPPKLNKPAVAEVEVGPVDVCDKEEDFVPKPKTFDEAAVVVGAVVFGAEEFPKENKFAGAAAVVVGVGATAAAGAAGLEPPKLNIFGGDFVVAGAAAGAAAGVTEGAPNEKALLVAELLLGAALPAVVVVVPPPKLKAGGGAEVVVLVGSWKLGAVLAAAVLLPPKLKVSEGAETELVVEATVEVAPRPNVRVLAVGVLSG